MKYSDRFLKRDERAVMELRELYEMLGYKKYKMSKFEEYELYLENKSFLAGDNVITFTDSSGKLLALKPDVTLSIVKNSAKGVEEPQRLYYNENVYRTENGSNEFREIMQVGLEYIGEIDLYSLCEVITLAKKSLETICEKYAMDISHMGFVNSILESGKLRETAKEKILKCIEQKNQHEIKGICASEGMDEEFTKKIMALAALSGSFEETLSAAKALGNGNREAMEALSELENVFSVLKETGEDKNINLDFSIINDLNYYNGIIFQGFIEGVPCGILSGGRYDRLLEKFGRRTGAIGFAIYTSLIDLYDKAADGFDADAVVIYDEMTDFARLSLKVKELNDEGMSVTARKNDKGKLKAKRVYKFNGEGLDLIEAND